MSEETDEEFQAKIDKWRKENAALIVPRKQRLAEILKARIERVHELLTMYEQLIESNMSIGSRSVGDFELLSRAIGAWDEAVMKM